MLLEGGTNKEQLQICYMESLDLSIFVPSIEEYFRCDACGKLGYTVRVVCLVKGNRFDNLSGVLFL